MEPIIETTPAKTEKPKRNTFGSALFAGFDGEYWKGKDALAILPEFREHYFRTRFDEAGNRKSVKHVVDGFNLLRPGKRPFFPQTGWVRKHVKVWDQEILDKRRVDGLAKYASQQVAKQLDLAPDKVPEVKIELTADTMEKKAMTLGDRLMADAEKELGLADEELDPEVRVKQKGYALNVYNLVTRNALKRQELDLKSNAEKRNQAGFVLDLLNKAMSGKMSPEALAVLKSSVPAPVTAEPVPDAHEVRQGG